MAGAPTKRFEDRPVAVFGGSGFIGRHLVAKLRRAGAAVRIVARHAQREKLAELGLGADGIDWVAADILDAAAVDAATRGAGAVVNLVGALSESGRQSYAALHVDGARCVAAAAARSGVAHLIYFSALGASPAAPSRADRSKAAGEAAVRAAFPSAAIVRPSLTFGRGDHFFSRFAQMARRSPILPLIGGGVTRFQPAHVDDVAQGCLAILSRPEAAGRTYEFGGPRTYSFRELIAFLCAVCRARPILLPVPFGIAEALGAALELLPRPPLTRDQVRLLKTDKVVSDAAPKLRDLGVEPVAMEPIVSALLQAQQP